MKSYTLDFIRYALGLRAAATSDTDAELSLLAELASKSEVVVEIGVYEGVASRRMAETLPEGGTVHLVDPFFLERKLERVLGFSLTEMIAQRETRVHRAKCNFHRCTSAEAASKLRLHGKCDLVFVDARHDYDSVLADLGLWAPMLKRDGLLAFHDSRCCPARPDLSETTGPVRLLKEVEEGQHGPWTVVATVDSISVIKHDARTK